MLNDTDYFDFGLWWGKIITPVYRLRDLLFYLSDKESISFHLKNNNSVVSFDLESKVIISGNKEIIEKFTLELHSEFEYFGRKYLDNLVVFQFTILEHILENSTFLFLYYDNMLLKKTERINPEFQINKSFDIDILIKTELTKDIIKSVCNRACKYIVTGQIEKTLKRMEKLVGLKYSSDIIKFLQDLQEKRNAVVHETRFKTIESDYLYKTVEVFQEILVGLELKFQEKNIGYVRPFDW